MSNPKGGIKQFLSESVVDRSIWSCDTPIGRASCRGFPNSPMFPITFLKCIASCWPIFIFGLHFPGTLIFVPCAKCFVFYTLRSRGAWGRPNVPKMPLLTFRFRRLDPCACAFGPNGWNFRRSEPSRGSHLAPQGPFRRLGARIWCPKVLIEAEYHAVSR